MPYLGGFLIDLKKKNGFSIDRNALVNLKPGTWVPGDGRDLHVECHFKNDTPQSNFGQVPAGRGKNCV